MLMVRNRSHEHFKPMEHFKPLALGEVTGNHPNQVEFSNLIFLVMLLILTVLIMLLNACLDACLYNDNNK